MLNYNTLVNSLNRIQATSEWLNTQTLFNNSKHIFLIGHAGNLNIAEYAACNITKYSGGLKRAVAPGSAMEITLHIHDTNFDEWIVRWLQNSTTHFTEDDWKNSLVMGFSSSGTSLDVINALEWANKSGMHTACLTARSLIKKPTGNIEILLDTEYYYVAESLSSLLTYCLIDGAGYHLRTIKNSNQEIREHSNPDEMTNLGIDFDGVIHKNTKGFYDGTVYDDPIDGAIDALKELSKKYKIICYTAKAKKDRPLINGKTGTELVWEWLKKHNMDSYVSEVTAEKPRAVAYIDDKAFRFSGWQSCMNELKTNNLI